MHFLARWTHRDLELWSFEPKTWVVHLCPKTHQSWKFGENTFQYFSHTKTKTHERQENLMLPAALRWRRHKNVQILPNVHVTLLSDFSYVQNYDFNDTNRQQKLIKIFYINKGLSTLFYQLSLYHKLRFDYDTTTIRRYHDAFDYDGSDRNYDLRSIRLRCGYDTTTAKIWHVHFYRAMHVVLARYCYRKSSVVPLVCNVNAPWAYRLD